MKALTEEVLKDKIRGCFIGKNIGGTLGAPFEGKTEMNEVSFYTQELSGNPLPNDDLDLQLVWLVLAEYYGLDRLTSRHFGEYWINALIGPWGEYSNCRWNCLDGFYPPLSGACGNRELGISNGAWIRSEIWACLFAGRPDDAIRYAWMDASCDHAGDGIYAEMFTAALEAAAFYCSDLRELLKIGLAKIPQEGRLRECIELVIAGYEGGKDWKTVRNQIVERNRDIGWFQAAGNVPFAVLALLYGEGDMGKTVCLAVNCGDDTDCTAATAGAILGIMQGASAIPERWTKPIGDGIASISFNNFAMPLPAPTTVTELTERVLKLRRIGTIRDPEFACPEKDFLSGAAAKAVWERPSFLQSYDLFFVTLEVTYPDGPYLEPGKPCRLKLTARNSLASSGVLRACWQLPENWTASPTEVHLGIRNFCLSEIECSVTPPADANLPAMTYLMLEVRTDDRVCPAVVTVPFRLKDSCRFPGHRGPDVSGSGWFRRSGLMRGIREITGK